ncbi:hypothetical protein AB6A40_001966 [Gnathostoma spinigerum]|uniref:Uncharacterized protein n=1 Tax=Gnathostoma spinigerum TaxID=75299 RepID=A0ABD6EF07_9BILA
MYESQHIRNRGGVVLAGLSDCHDRQFDVDQGKSNKVSRLTTAFHSRSFFSVPLLTVPSYPISFLSHPLANDRSLFEKYHHYRPNDSKFRSAVHIHRKYCPTTILSSASQMSQFHIPKNESSVENQNTNQAPM